MKIRNLIVRITGTLIVMIILTIVYLSLIYKFPQKYTYVIDDNFFKSKNCYVDENDNRVCEVKGNVIRVEMFYEVN